MSPLLFLIRSHSANCPLALEALYLRSSAKSAVSCRKFFASLVLFVVPSFLADLCDLCDLCERLLDHNHDYDWASSPGSIVCQGKGSEKTHGLHGLTQCRIGINRNLELVFFSNAHYEMDKMKHSIWSGISACIAYLSLFTSSSQVMAKDEWYFTTELGIVATPDITVTGTDNDWSTQCDKIINPDELEVSGGCGSHHHRHCGEMNWTAVSGSLPGLPWGVVGELCGPRGNIPIEQPLTTSVPKQS